MTRLRHAVVMECTLDLAYALARDVEHYPDFLPGYLESRIIERQGDRVLLQRKALLGKQIKEWKSWASFQHNQTIVFVHAEGPLEGMTVTWEFRALSPQKTELVITHIFEIRHPRGLGWLTEQFIYKPKIDHLAGLVVNAFKAACERQPVITA